MRFLCDWWVPRVGREIQISTRKIYGNVTYAYFQNFSIGGITKFCFHLSSFFFWSTFVLREVLRSEGWSGTCDNVHFIITSFAGFGKWNLLKQTWRSSLPAGRYPDGDIQVTGSLPYRVYWSAGSMKILSRASDWLDSQNSCCSFARILFKRFYSVCSYSF